MHIEVCVCVERQSKRETERELATYDATNERGPHCLLGSTNRQHRLPGLTTEQTDQTGSRPVGIVVV